MHAFMTVANSGATSTGAGTATWVTMGNVTVPAWATRARVCLAMNGVTALGTTSQLDLVVKIGASTSTTGPQRMTTPAVTTRFSLPLNDLLTSVPTGSQSVTLVATFQTGTFTMSATASTIGLN